MRQRNAARRHSREAFGGSGSRVADAAMAVVIPRFTWPPPNHPTLQRIGRTSHRILAAEIVRRTRRGHSYDEILLGAMRAAFPRSNYGDDVLRERGRKLAMAEPIYGVVRALLAEDR